MDPNPNPIPSTGTTSAPFFSPTSLLWAHQLRREHNSLVSRLDALEAALASSSADGVARAGELKTELDRRVGEVGGVVGVVKEEIGVVKGEIETLKGWKGLVEERQREAVERREREEEELRREREGREEGRGELERGLRDVLEGVRGLKGLVEEMRRERAEWIERERERERKREREKELNTIPVAVPYSNPDLSDDNEPFRSSSLPPIPHLLPSQQRPKHEVPSTISGTPTMTHLPSSTLTRSSLPPPQAPPHNGYSAILVPDSTSPAPPSLHPGQTIATTAASATGFPTSPPRAACSLVTQPPGELEYENAEAEEQDNGVPILRQGPGESLESYLERGEAVLSRSPRIEAKRVVLAFWRGVDEEEVKRALGEELETWGQRWEVVRRFVGDLRGEGRGEGKGKRRKRDRDRCLDKAGGEKDVGVCGNAAVEEKKSKNMKMRKRRAIPVIWPVDEEGEGWFVVQNGLT
ncbi:hypothetical protein BDDG_00213 [Blastomyces dermatitidis ATCC 18188]|uniref:Uncharacterized protein n=1 Tax=Ajellomyces dermatitidis (strain ATCC 18188 / CBS 674.68) TaxID=653446 RepID=F2T316_AJEDA|nr:hypothetical protein BDDG_00213 [Blastomyces dermatitidis ATCC 18188]